MIPTSKWDQLQGEAQGVVANSLKDATDERCLKLETGMTELPEPES